MFHHIIKLSSISPVKAAASPRILRKFSSSSTEAAAARSPISVLYPKINNKVVRGVMEYQKSLIDDEGNGKKPAAAAAAGPPDLEISLRPFQLTTTDVDEISLRPFQLTDVDDMMAWGTDEELSRYCRWKIDMPKEAYCRWEAIKPYRPPIWFPGETYKYHGWDLEIYRSKEDALEDIKNNIIPHPWYRAICLKNNNRPIGKIFIDPCRRNNPYMAELGFVVASEHWGKGIATTAVKMALDTVLKEWPHLIRLQATAHVENLGAQRVLEKAGFLNEGVISMFGRLDKEGRYIALPIFSFLP